MKTIKDVELQVEAKMCEMLRKLDLLPEGYWCSVRLHGKSRDKKRTASFETSWSPDTDSIRIEFQRAPDQSQAVPNATAQSSATATERTAKSGSPISDHLSDLIRALDRAESRPGFGFVALKWFRDTALQSGGFSWAIDYSERQTVLQDAIERRLILTSKIPNPKSPQFPVTAIRLNRLMPEVRSILGIGVGQGPDFQPVPISGENLSATILTDRR
jgi:hypothetical protein